jgi:hypothetical protein
MKNSEGERPFERPRQRWHAGFKMNLKQDVAIWTRFIWTGIRISVRPFCT